VRYYNMFGVALPKENGEAHQDKDTNYDNDQLQHRETRLLAL
jgi:hypothetical protein